MNTADAGPGPYVLNVENETLANDFFRVTKWTGAQMQMTLMTIAPGDDIGLEQHTGHDQFLRIEQGSARVEMGATKEDLNFVKDVAADWAIFVPAGTWHNVRNTGNESLKLYSIYAPAEHQPGTIHRTKAEAQAAEHMHE